MGFDTIEINLVLGVRWKPMLGGNRLTHNRRGTHPQFHQTNGRTMLQTTNKQTQTHFATKADFSASVENDRPQDSCNKFQLFSFLAAKSSSRSDVVTKCVRSSVRSSVMKEFFFSLKS